MALGTWLAFALANTLVVLIDYEVSDGLRAQFRRPGALRLLNHLGATCLAVAGLFTLRLLRAS